LDDKFKSFRIEHIGNLSLYKQYKILECFMEDDDKILFHRFNTKLSEIKPSVLERLKNEIYEDFCDDILFFQPGNKEILISNIMDILSLCKIKYKCVDIVENLFTKLLAQDEEVLNWVEIGQIKSMIFDMFYFNNDNLDEKKWIKDKIIFKNKIYLNGKGIKHGTTSSIWYCPENCDEIIHSMIREVHYSCIVLNKKAMFFSKYKYGFYYKETAESFDLCIFDNCGCFIENVIPKLLKQDLKIECVKKSL
jgi:hypothetical protein